MASTYSDAVMEHFRNPRNCGELEDASAAGEAVNPLCGDRLRLTLKIGGGRIVAARFKAFGCVAAIASASRLTEMLEGRTLEQARALTNREVADSLGGLPGAQQACSVLAEQALREALDRYEAATSD